VAYEKLEKCCQQGNEKVFKFKKNNLEELFLTLVDKPSKLATPLTGSFVARSTNSLCMQSKWLRSKICTSERLSIEKRLRGEQQNPCGREKERIREQLWTKQPVDKQEGQPLNMYGQQSSFAIIRKSHMSSALSVTYLVQNMVP